MHRRIRAASAISLVAAGVAGLVLVGGATTTSTPPAAGTVNVATPFVDRQQYGTLELHTEPGGGLAARLVIPGVVDEYVPLTPRQSDRCRILTGDETTRRTLDEFFDLQVVNVTIGPDGKPAEVTPDAAGPALGLVDNGIGSRDQNNCNTNNGRLEPGQGLAITLGSDSRLEDVVFDYGYLDIEGKFGADLYAVTSLAGQRVGVVEDGLGNANDNNADSGGNDNNRIQIGERSTLTPGPTPGVLGDAADDFDRLVILPVNSTVANDARSYFFRNGELALDGGGDFPDATSRAANRTVFNLVTSETFEYTVVCDNENGVYTPNPDGTVQGIIETLETDLDWEAILDGTADYPDQARLFRYQGFMTDPETGERVPKPCPPIGVDLSADALRGVLLEPSDETAFLRLELTWIVPASLVDLAAGEPFARTIDLDGDGPLEPQDARYCESFDGTDPFEPAAAGDAIHPADTPWCVLSDERELTKVQQLDQDGIPVVDENGAPVLVDVVIQRMVWDGLGDPYFR